MSKLPFSIFQYSSHLEFLQDAYDTFHSKDESFSYDKIATACGIRSRTETRNIFKGIKKPTETNLASIGTLFGLDEDEKQYLSCLYRFHEAGGSPTAYQIFQNQNQIPSPTNINRTSCRTVLVSGTCTMEWYTLASRR